MPAIPSLEITIGTGDDDLRGDSSATAYVLVQMGDDLKEFSTILKNETDPGWANDSNHGPIIWNLPPGVSDQNLERFGIRLQSHPSGFPPETDDNWNINTVLVTYPDGAGGQSELINVAGVPLSRLTADQPEWTANLT
jgi:carbohydrate-binding DOMON domain-containing protein